MTPFTGTFFRKISPGTAVPSSWTWVGTAGGSSRGFIAPAVFPGGHYPGRPPGETDPGFQAEPNPVGQRTVLLNGLRRLGVLFKYRKKIPTQKHCKNAPNIFAKTKGPPEKKDGNLLDHRRIERAD